MVAKLGGGSMKRKATSIKKKEKNVVLLEEEIRRAFPHQQWPVNAKKKRIPRLHSIKPGSMLLKRHQNRSGGTSSGVCLTISCPEELVEEILSRLPVICLARFSYVCKSWYRLIRSDRFTSLHINNYKTSHPLVSTIGADFKLSFFPEFPQNYITSPQIEVKVVAPTSPYDRAPRLFLKVMPPYLGGSCHGILCLYKKYVGSIALWNPATKDFKSIPNSDLPREYSLKNSTVTVMFGFDANKNDYKILQMVSVGDSKIVELRLFSLRKNSWRKIDSHDFTFHVPYCTSDLVCNLPSTDYRVICALTKPLSRPTKLEILSFDLSTELFDMIEISCPSLEAELAYVDGVDKHFYEQIKLFQFNQSLAIANNNYLNDKKYMTNVWVLNESTRSWNKMFSVRVDKGFRIIGSWENHIMIENTYSYILGCFDPGKKKVTDYLCWTPGKASCTVYKESLVRVSEMNEDKEMEEGNTTCTQSVLFTDMNEGNTKRRKGKKVTRKQGVPPVRAPNCNSSWQFY